jgi:iron complex outermembrane recepter protein
VRQRGFVLAGIGLLGPFTLSAQARDTLARTDSLHPVLLAPVAVSATRVDRPLVQVPNAVQFVAGARINQGRPTWGLDEALVTVPGVYAANRYNFSLDQRISIRGFGARSAFAVRGIQVLLDGIPQTLPDGTGQLTNVDLGDADRLEVLRGSSSALFGNAAGGVISIWTNPAPPVGVTEDLRVTAGSFGRHQLPLFDSGQTWTKWQSTTRFRLGDGGGAGQVSVSRLAYSGERQHSDADLRNLRGKFQFPLAPAWSLTVIGDYGDDPRADNPGQLTARELATNRDSAAALNITRQAGKDVWQLQGGATLRREFAAGGEASVTLYGFSRGLTNPTTFAFIDLKRRDYGVRTSITKPVPLGSRPQRLTAGFDFQRQRDDRLNFGNNAGTPDTVRQLDQLEHVTEIGPFVQSAVDVLPRTTLTGGLRYDWVSFSVQDRLITATNPDDSGRRRMAALSGSVGITHQLSDAANVYGNVGTSFETPTTTELTNRPDTAGGFNPHLEPQKAVNYEVGATGSVARRLNYSVAVYRAEVRGELISQQIASSPGRVFFQNAGRSRHQGLEVGLDWLVTPGLTAVASWTYSDFRYTSYTTGTRVLDGQRLPGVPKYWLHLLLEARPSLARGGWADVEMTHSSGFGVDDTIPSIQTSPWWTTNVRLGWDGTVGSLRFSPFVGFDNIFNRHYVSSVAINAAPIRIGAATIPGRYYEPAPGRNAYLGFSLGAGR